MLKFIILITAHFAFSVPSLARAGMFHPVGQTGDCEELLSVPLADLAGAEPPNEFQFDTDPNECSEVSLYLYDFWAPTRVRNDRNSPSGITAQVDKLRLGRIIVRGQVGRLAEIQLSPTETIRRLAVSPNGELLAVNSSHSQRIYNIANQQLVLDFTRAGLTDEQAIQSVLHWGAHSSTLLVGEPVGGSMQLRLISLGQHRMRGLPTQHLLHTGGPGTVLMSKPIRWLLWSSRGRYFALVRPRRFRNEHNPKSLQTGYIFDSRTGMKLGETVARWTDLHNQLEILEELRL